MTISRQNAQLAQTINVNSTAIGDTISIPSSGIVNISGVLNVSGVQVSVSGHPHVSTDISDWAEAVQDVVGASGFLVGQSGISLSYNDVSNTLTITGSGGATITNAADNRVLTSDGTSTGINGESNLTFDGTNLNVTGVFNIDNLRMDANTISSTNSNGNIVLAPNGTGDVQVDADTLRVGDSNTAATITTNGTGNLVLNTNSGTNSGSITIAQGANTNITISPNGTGDVYVDADTLRIGDSGSAATLTTNGAGNLTINTNSGTNSGALVVNQGSNGNITITPHGTGKVGIGTNSPSYNIDAYPGVSSATLRVGSYAIVENVVSDQAMFARNVVHDNVAGWKSINSNYTTAIRMNNDFGDGSIAFHLHGNESAGTNISATWDSSDIKMVIRNGGNVGIGTTNPSYTLSVNGGAQFNQLYPTVVNGSIVAGAVDTDITGGQIFNITLTENIILNNPSNSVDGVTIRWRISQDATGGRTVTLDSKFVIPSSASNPLPWSTAANAMDMLAATYDSTRDKWDIVAFVPGY